jgi:hypothetical protein
MKWFKTVMLLVCLLILTAGCSQGIKINLPRPEIPPAPILKTEPLNHPQTGKPGVWFSLEDVGKEAKYREDLIAEIKKGQVAVGKANEFFRSNP